MCAQPGIVATAMGGAMAKATLAAPPVLLGHIPLQQQQRHAPLAPWRATPPPPQLLLDQMTPFATSVSLATLAATALLAAPTRAVHCATWANSLLRERRSAQIARPDTPLIAATTLAAMWSVVHALLVTTTVLAQAWSALLAKRESTRIQMEVGPAQAAQLEKLLNMVLLLVARMKHRVIHVWPDMR